MREALSPYKIGINVGFLRGQTKFFLSESDAFHQEGHIFRKDAHSLLALLVKVGFSLFTSVDTVPLLA